jgi:hypothetical protein
MVDPFFLRSVRFRFAYQKAAGFSFATEIFSGIPLKPEKLLCIPEWYHACGAV